MELAGRVRGVETRWGRVAEEMGIRSPGAPCDVKPGELLSRVLDALPVSAYVVDSNLRVVLWNVRREHGPQGVRRHQAIGRRISEVVPGEGGQRAELELAQVLGTGQPVEQIVRSDDGRRLRSSRIPVWDGNAVTHVLCIFDDLTAQLDAEDQLTEVGRHYRLLFEHNPLPMWVYEPDTLAILDVNEAAVRHYGYSREEFLDVTIRDIRPPEEVGKLLEYLLSGPPPRDTVCWRHRKKDGSLIDVEETSHLLEYQGRAARLVLGADVTERLAAQRALLEHEASLREAQSIAHVGSWEWSLTSGQLKWSDELLRVRGLTPGHPVSTTLFWQGVHPDDRARVQEAGEQAVRDRAPFSYDYRIVNADGDIRTLHAVGHLRLDESGRVVGLVGTDQDVTDMKATEEALWARTEQLQAVADAMSAYVRGEDLVTASASLLEVAMRQTSSKLGFVGLLEEGAVLRIVAQSGAPNSDAATFPDLDGLCGRAATTGRAVLSNSPSSDPRGGPRTAESSLTSFLGAPVLGTEGVLGMMGLANRPGGYAASDLEQLALLSEAAGVVFEGYQRQNRERRLESQFRGAQKMEAVGQLAAGVAHDFNNILGVILGQGDLLRRTLAPGERPAQRVEEILRASERAVGLTRQLLAFGRKQFLAPRVVDLNAVVSDMSSMLKRLIGERVEFVSALGTESERTRVKVDPGQVEQILMNLVVNARDAMPTGGTLTISTESVDLSDEWVAGHPGASAGPHVVLRVADSGHGMDAKVLSHIFEPFYTTKAAGKGTGLGLSTVYGIVKQSGGYIEVESSPGCGARFSVFLPLTDSPVDEPGQRHAPRTARTRPPAAGDTILVVEDEESLRAILRDILENAGYNVLDRGGPAEALALVHSYDEPIDLVLTDVVLPEVSGVEMAKLILAARDEKPAILYMSGYPDEVLGHEPELVLGVNFLQKPFREGELLSEIVEVLAARQAALHAAQ